MYDITNYASLAHVDDWYEIVDKEIEHKFPIIFVGGKTDLIHLKEVSTRKAMEILKFYNFSNPNYILNILAIFIKKSISFKDSLLS